MVEEDQVARLFAPEVQTASPHRFDDVAIAHVAAQQLAVVVLDGALEAEIAHHGGDQGSATEALRAKHPSGAQGHDHVAVDLVALFVDHDDAVRIPVESDAEVRAALPNLARAGLWVQCANLVVDVLAVGPDANRMCFRAELGKDQRRGSVGGPVSRVDHDPDAFECQIIGEGGFDECHVTPGCVVQALCAADTRPRRTLFVDVGPKDEGLHLVLDIIG